MTSDRAICVLAVDDDPVALELVQAALSSESVKVITAETAADGLALARKWQPEVAIVDLILPGASGLDMLDELLTVVPQCDVVLLTGHYSTESAVEAIQRGASDYLTKPISVRDLRAKIGAYLAESERRLRAMELEREAATANSFHGIIGRSSAMADVFARIRRIAPHYRSVLVLGDTGTGKELVSRAIHELSPVAKGPFVVCNCSAVAETLFESELFGHVKGSFTGATANKIGFFEAANGGTLFLDELGDLPLAMQTKLLRAIQNQEVQRVGSPEAVRVSVRIIGATNRDLHGMMAAGGFREDLYYRLAMVEVKLPSLSQRPDDIPLLARHFIAAFAKEYAKEVSDITTRAMVALVRHPWPGNIRELENVIGHAAMMAEGATIDLDDFPPEYSEANAESFPAFPREKLPTLAEIGRRYARHALDVTHGNKARTAELLGISRATLYKMLSEKEGPEPQPANPPDKVDALV
ncbi:MAG: sigma-54-dependent Fis family transcriptional regulator [Bryobacterales bacterium]|nr:sigma-54-dependent Fis family transcriptional regulator [Bryobacterales bacterium]